MALYRVEREDGAPEGECASLVIRARNEKEARKLVLAEGPGGPVFAGLTESNIRITKVRSTGRTAIVSVTLGED